MIPTQLKNQIKFSISSKTKTFSYKEVATVLNFLKDNNLINVSTCQILYFKNDEYGYIRRSDNNFIMKAEETLKNKTVKKSKVSAINYIHNNCIVFEKQE